MIQAKKFNSFQDFLDGHPELKSKKFGRTIFVTLPSEANITLLVTEENTGNLIDLHYIYKGHHQKWSSRQE